jgi:hypothetical protein
MMRIMLLFLLICCLTLATMLDPQFQRLRAADNSDAGVLAALMGDSRRLFAHEFFAMADAYFHRGFYPSIFEAGKPEAKSDFQEDSKPKADGAKEHEEEEISFLGQPTDWIDRFGRHFYPTVHTHLANGNEREILPWLQLSAELDPHEIAPYLTASYWLRTSLKKPFEAEQFLHKGLIANPDSYEILLELGRIKFHNENDYRVARNLFLLARQKWLKQDAAGAQPDPHTYEEILGEIVRLDQAEGDLKQQLADMEELLKVAKGSFELQVQINELKAKLEKK